MHKIKRIIFPSLLGISLAALALTSITISGKSPEKVEGYNASSLPTTIDLNDTTEANIRSYYSSLNNLTQNERQGSNLLKNLKTILKNGQKYYSYENGTSIWQMYEITDRDWTKSPASSTTYGSYNAQTNKITNYVYGTSSSSSKNNPYIHALYINRNVNNQTTAWDDHNQDQWGINREHVWPKAEGFDSSGAGGARGDPMHLMAGNGYSNNIHSNYFYGYVKTSSSYTDCGSKYSNQSGNLRGTSKTLNTGTVFEPQDSDKGDIARAIFYMVARYNYLSGSDSDGIDTNNPNLTLTQNISDWSSSGYTSSTSTQGKLGVLTDLLAWHHADPVDDYEIHRNNLLYTNFTNNRNPFIDFPEWVDYIWGTATYNGTTYQSYSSTPTGYATPSSDTVNGYNSGSSVAVTGVTLNSNAEEVEVGNTVSLTATIAPANATDKGITWTSSNTSVATVNNGTITGVAEGNATITATTHDGGHTATCAITVTESTTPVVETATVSYTVTSTTTASSSGETPSGSSVSFSTTYSDMEKMTSGNSQTWTLSGYNGLTIKSIELDLHRNSNAGAGTITLTNNGNGVTIDHATLTKNDTTTEYSFYEILQGDLEVAGDLVLTISATSNSLYCDSIVVEYEKPVLATSLTVDTNNVELDLNGTTTNQIVATVSPDNTTDKSLTYVSADTGIATVSNTGLITAVAVGSTTVTVSTNDGSNLSQTINVYVTEPTIHTVTTTIKYGDTFSGDTMPGTTNGANTNKSFTDETSGISFSSYGIYSYSNYSSLALTPSGAFLYNTSETPNISKIEVKYASEISTSAKIAVHFGTSPLSTRNEDGKTTISGKGETETFTPSQSGNGYFQIATTGTFYFKSITVYHDFISEGKTILFDSREQGYTSGGSLDGTIETIYNNSDTVNLSFAKESGSNNPAYYTNGTAIRLYAKNTLTITSSCTNLMGVAFTFGSDDGTNEITVDKGVYFNGVWSSSTLTNSVTFTIGGTKGNRRIQTITVEYYNANLFAADFLDEVKCYNGVTPPNSTKWNDMKNLYTDSLFVEEQNLVKGATANEYGSILEQAMARYVDIQSKYSHDTYNDFLGLNISSLRHIYLRVNNNEVVVVAAFGLILLVAIGGTFFYESKKKKRKHI